MEINQRVILNRILEGGSRLETIDLVSIYFEDSGLFNRLFRKGQKIYDESFPIKEKEPIHVIRYEYIEPSALDLRDKTNENYGEGRFFYIAALLDGIVRGMISFNIIHTENSLEVFGGYVAVEESYRRRGIGRLLFNSLVRASDIHGRSDDKSLDYVVGEVEKPSVDYRNPMRDIIRPMYHHNVVGFGAASVVDNSGKVTLVPYSQPGVRIEETTPPAVPLLFAITLIGNGVLNKISLDPDKAVSVDGHVNEDNFDKINSMDPSDFHESVKGILDDYRSGSVYSQRQIDNIERRIVNTINRASRVHFIPISDARYCEWAK